MFEYCLADWGLITNVGAVCFGSVAVGFIPLRKKKTIQNKGKDCYSVAQELRPV